MNELALFAGAGGGILGGQLLGWRTVCAVERDAYAAAVLVQRQNDGLLDLFPIWSDVTTFDGKPWRGIVDVVSGGFPCQNISIIGDGSGIDGEKSGLWSEFARIIRDVRSPFVFLENSPMLISRGIDRVLGDLAEIGYDAEWGVYGADEIGAPHIRKRLFIVAHSGSIGLEKKKSILAESTQKNERTLSTSTDGSTWASGFCKPTIPSLVDGLATYVGEVNAIGNGIVPQCAAEAFRQLLNRIKEA